jgi:hypothetical protein
MWAKNVKRMKELLQKVPDKVSDALSSSRSFDSLISKTDNIASPKLSPALLSPSIEAKFLDKENEESKNETDFVCQLLLRKGSINIAFEKPSIHFDYGKEYETRHVLETISTLNSLINDNQLKTISLIKSLSDEINMVNLKIEDSHKDFNSSDDIRFNSGRPISLESSSENERKNAFGEDVSLTNFKNQNMGDLNSIQKVSESDCTTTKSKLKKNIGNSSLPTR